MNNYLNIANYLSTNTYDLSQPVDHKYDINLNKMICPCCGKKLCLTDSTKAEFIENNMITVSESTQLNENKLSDYLLGIIEDEAKNILADEFDVNEPETDDMGNIIGDYTDRFIYVDKDLKKVIKLKAGAISNMLKHQGIEVSSFYIEDQLFQILKAYGYSGNQ